LAVVTGFGDSMKPLFNPGDPLLVDTGVRAVEFDAIYFFRIGEEGFIKRLQRVPGEGLIAISENKSYKDWVIREGMDFEVFARVVKVWRGEDF
jgi:phage repressor protein C with HTH and peptisase S24 domain